MNYVRRFFAPAKMARQSTLSISLFDIVRSLLAVGLVYCIQYATGAIESDDVTLFHQWIFVALGIGLVVFLINVFWKAYAFKYFRDSFCAIEQLCVPTILNGDNNQYEKLGTGKMISIYQKGVRSWSLMIADLGGKLMGSVVFFVAFLVTVYQKDVSFFFVCLGTIALSCAWFMVVGRRQFFWRKKSKEVTIELSRLWARWFMSKVEISQQGKVSQELTKSGQLHDQFFRYKKIEKIHQGASFDGVVFFSTLMYIGLVYYAGKHVLFGSMNYSDLVVIVGLGSMFVNDLDSIMRTIRMGIIDRWVDVEKLREIVDLLSDGRKSLDQGPGFVPHNGSITLTNATFSYTESNPILSNLSLTIPGGSKTALVGPSGGGKSTIIKLVAGYLRPDSGSVTVDDQDLTDVSLKSYYKHIGYLTQEPSVFDGTIWENLTYAMEETCHSALDAESSTSDTDPGSSQGGQKEELRHMDTEVMERVKQAISDAQCEFIWDLPDGVDTEIGERGVRLSGGQRQRLAIAKIFLKNPEIVLLDEPTSALDSESEEKVTIAMNRLFENRTVIVIAHRLQTVKHADQILYIEAGEVVESGTHEELMSQEGKYYKMVELQSGF